jgi:hypothetical protein
MSIGQREAAQPDMASDAAIIAIEHDMAGDMAQMEEALGAVLALKRDARLQACLRPAGHQGPFAVSLPGRWTWIELGGARHGTLYRRAPTALPGVSLDEAITANERIGEEVRRAVQRTGAYHSAQQIVRAFIVPTILPDRAAASRLLRWSSVVEIIAYRIAGRAISVLDGIRPAVMARGLADDPVAQVLRRKYWLIASLMARCTLLGADRDASAWLNDMGDSFAWEGWTPSRALVRERSLWLTAIGARSAAVFGRAAIDRYAARFEIVRHPVDILDCLVGMVSIGLAEGDSSPSLIASLTRFKASIASRDLIMPQFAGSALDQAIWMLQHREAAAAEAEGLFLASTEPRSPFGAEGILQSDPTRSDRNGRILGLSILPLAVTRAREDFFPRAQPRRDNYAGLSDDDILRIINVAWIGAVIGETLQ